MGCPEIYYKQALKKLESRLCGTGHVRTILEEDDANALENIVSNLKETVEDKEFYFEAGVVFSTVYDFILMSGRGDALDDCLCGLDEFEEFIKGL